jgi:predicted  nucleic acid-binding Zn-ribbon protein
MITAETIVALLPSILVAIGVWVQLNSEVAKLKGRTYHLEADRDDLKDLMRELRTAIEDLREKLAAK